MDTSFLRDSRYLQLDPENQRKVFDQTMFGLASENERFTSLPPETQKLVLDDLWEQADVLAETGAQSVQEPEQTAWDQNPVHMRDQEESGIIRGAKNFTQAATGPGIDQMQLALSDMVKGDLPLEDSEYDKRQQAQIDEYFKSISEQKAMAPSTQAGVSTPLSVATSGIGMAAGLGASALTGGNIAVGSVAGGAVPAAIMYRVGKFDALRQIRDELKSKYTLTDEDWKNLQHNLDAEVSKAGLFESGGEFVSDALGYAIFKVPVGKLGKPLAALIGQKTAQKIVGNTIGKLGLKAAGTVGVEIGGEATTKMGRDQAMYEAEQKLPEGTKLTSKDFDPEDNVFERALKAVKDVGPATAIQTLAVGGARGIVNYAGNRLARGGKADPTDTAPPSVSEDATANPQVTDATTGPSPQSSVYDEIQSLSDAKKSLGTKSEYIENALNASPDKQYLLDNSEELKKFVSASSSEWTLKTRTLSAQIKAKEDELKIISPYGAIDVEFSDVKDPVGEVKAPAVPIVLAETVDDAVEAFEKEVSKTPVKRVEPSKSEFPAGNIDEYIDNMGPTIASPAVGTAGVAETTIQPETERAVESYQPIRWGRIFKTERAAAESIKQRGIKGVAPKKVDGGYAIEAVAPVEAPKIVSEAETQPEAQTPPVEPVSASVMAPEVVPESPQVQGRGLKLFKTEKGAKASIRQRKLEGYEPVQVDGGFRVAKKAEQLVPVEEATKSAGADEQATLQAQEPLGVKEATDSAGTSEISGEKSDGGSVDRTLPPQESMQAETQLVDQPDEIFVRKPTKAEKNGGGTPRMRGFEKLPDAPDGYEKVYKPYGESGEGYYYKKLKQEPSGSQTQKSEPQTDLRVVDEPQSKAKDTSGERPQYQIGGEGTVDDVVEAIDRARKDVESGVISGSSYVKFVGAKGKAEYIIGTNKEVLDDFEKRVKKNIAKTTKPQNKPLMYSTREGTKTDITEEQVQRAFGKAATVAKTSDTTFDITTPSGKVTLKVVDRIPIDEKAFEAAYGRKATPEEIERGASGAYQDGRILISPVGDQWTITHEEVHWLMASGVLSFNDARAILRSAGVDGRNVTPENIGEYEEQIAAHIENVRMERAKPVGRAKEIIRKILDFVDGLVNLVGVRTARGVVKDIESGKIFDEADVAEGGGDIKYSTRVKAQRDFNNGIIDTIKDYGQVLLPAKLTKVGKQDLNRIRDLILRTPAFFAKKIHAVKAIFDASQKRVDRFWNLLNEMENDKINGEVVNTLKQLDAVKKLSEDGYNAVGKYLTDADKNDTGFRIKIGEDDKWAVVDPKGTTIKSFESQPSGGRDLGEDAAIEHMLDAEGESLAGKGFTKDQLLAVRAFRMSTNKGFDLSLSNLKRVIALHEKSGTEMPTIKVMGDDGKMKPVSIREVMNIMGERRGTYFPRIRKPGTYILTATKEGQDKQLIKYSLLEGGFMNKKADELRREGWTVETSKEQRVGEDVFQLNGDLIKTQQILDAAIARVEKGDFSDKDLEAEMLHMITTAVTEQVAEVVRERGARVHMNRRSKEYWAGYEIDPKIAISSYIRGMAAGEAKREMTSRMMKALTGTEVTWDRYQDITQYDGDYASWMDENKDEQDADLVTEEMFDVINDPEWAETIGNATLDLEAMLKTETDKDMIATLKKDLSEKKQALYKRYNDFVKAQKIDNREQPVAFEWAKAYIAENTRNQEAVDRIIGTLRGLAVGKFLAFRVVAAPLTNMTSLPTTAIATMKAAGIPYRKTYGLLTRGIIDYGNYRLGRLKGDKAKVFDYIHQNGWDNAQYNSEAMSTLRSAVGKKYDWIIEKGMWTFSESERLNRAATIAALYHGLEAKYGDTKSFEELMDMANDISKQAHGIYNKGDLPFFALGKHPAAHLARMFYVFKKYQHVYFQNMARMGLEDGDYGAVAHMLISPAILAGAGASIAMPIVSTVLKAFGEDEPEEEMYRKVGSVWGDSAERFARFGASGMAGPLGISLKGSLQMDIGDSLFGAPGSVLKDTWEAMKYLSRGDISKGVEKALPTGLASPFKATREYTEGLTTKSNAPLFYGENQARPNLMEAFLRGMSLNPVGIATIREKQSKEYEVKEKYRNWSTDIYAKAKRMKLRGRMDQEKMAELLGEITKYNEGAVRWGLSPITKKSIKKNLKRNFKASRFERERSERNN